MIRRYELSLQNHYVLYRFSGIILYGCETWKINKTNLSANVKKFEEYETRYIFKFRFMKKIQYKLKDESGFNKAYSTQRIKFSLKIIGLNHQVCRLQKNERELSSKKSLKKGEKKKNMEL